MYAEHVHSQWGDNRGPGFRFIRSNGRLSRTERKVLRARGFKPGWFNVAGQLVRGWAKFA